MTDHRPTDLSYGHLGEATYDVDEQSWYFSSKINLGKLHQADHTDQCLSFDRTLHTAFASFTRVYTSVFASSSELDQDSFKSSSVTREMASKGPARGRSGEGFYHIYDKNSQSCLVGPASFSSACYGQSGRYRPNDRNKVNKNYGDGAW